MLAVFWNHLRSHKIDAVFHHLIAGQFNICATKITFSSPLQGTTWNTLFIPANQSWATTRSRPPRKSGGFILKNARKSVLAKCYGAGWGCCCPCIPCIIYIIIWFCCCICCSTWVYGCSTFPVSTSSSTFLVLGLLERLRLSSILLSIDYPTHEIKLIRLSAISKT